VLDLVKHSVRTIINILGENDNLAIIEFAGKANIVFGLTKMNE